MSSVQQGGAIVRSYTYNALGERVVSTIPGTTGNPDGSGGTPDVHTYTVYDESGRWLGDYDHNGAVLQQAIWLDDLPVGLLAGAGANQKLHYIEPDHLGSLRAVIDRTRDVAIWTWALQGEAFGNSPVYKAAAYAGSGEAANALATFYMKADKSGQLGDLQQALALFVRQFALQGDPAFDVGARGRLAVGVEAQGDLDSG
ncbi:hypothetical protein ASE10_10205 [Lysobacter sp. Root76]|nr:hypothetical protein ASE10_10205 [Lysobacter sp. Root76]KRD70725.1 hypothetical protein ASE45_02375 [Lysobacter sp. Root96]